MRIFPRLMGLIEQIIPQTQAKHSATVIFFHGSGRKYYQITLSSKALTLLFNLMIIIKIHELNTFLYYNTLVLPY